MIAMFTCDGWHLTLCGSWCSLAVWQGFLLRAIYHLYIFTFLCSHYERWGPFYSWLGLPSRPLRQPVSAGCTWWLCDRQFWLVTKSALEMCIRDYALYKLQPLPFFPFFIRVVFYKLSHCSMCLRHSCSTFYTLPATVIGRSCTSSDKDMTITKHYETFSNQKLFHQCSVKYRVNDV